MKTILVIAETPKTSDPAADTRNWRDFLAHIQNDAKRPKDTYALSEGVWLLPADIELPALGHLIEMAQADKISTRILFLEDNPAWLFYPPTGQ